MQLEPNAKTFSSWLSQDHLLYSFWKPVPLRVIKFFIIVLFFQIGLAANAYFSQTEQSVIARLAIGFETSSSIVLEFSGLIGI